MLDIETRNILSRWNLMRHTDLGYLVNPYVEEFYQLFYKVLVGKESQFDGKPFTTIKPILRGFAITEGSCYERCKVVECLDLDFIDFDEEAIRHLEWFLMNQPQNHLRGNSWYSQYEHALRNQKYTTTRFYYPHGIEGESMKTTVKEFDTLEKAIKYSQRYAKGIRFAGLWIENQSLELVYEITSDFEEIDHTDNPIKIYQ